MFSCYRLRPVLMMWTILAFLCNSVQGINAQEADSPGDNKPAGLKGEFPGPVQPNGQLGNCGPTPHR
jgi:hypothetical protein